MSRYAPMLFVLAAIWGASYLFIKIAVDEIAPAPMMAVRTLLAAAVLIAYVVHRFGWEQTRAEARTAGLAAATGVVDFILSPAEIARELARLSGHPFLVPPVEHHPQIELLPDGVLLGYRGSDDVERRTTIVFDPPPST